MRVLTMGVVGVCDDAGWPCGCACALQGKMKRKIIAVVMVFSLVGVASATLVNSNSIIEDSIEYYFQTDKSIYDLGENVEMLYRVTNLSDEDVTFVFTVGPVDDRCDFMVDKERLRIWDNLTRPSSDAETFFALGPLEVMNFYWSWDMADFDGEQVIPGHYDITGALSDLNLDYIEKYVPVSVQIDIIPEPATLLLVGSGLAGLLTCNKRKK